MRRREFIKIFGAGLAGTALTRRVFAQYPYQEPRTPKSDFYFAQLVYGKGLGWNPRPTVARSLANILNKRTSVPVSPERVEIKLSGNELFNYPFLYWSGESEFDPFSDSEISNLRTWIEAGGFLLADDALGMPDSGFDHSLRRELGRLFPGQELKQLPQTHTIFQSFYLLDSVTGRKASVPYVSGIDKDDLTVLIYSQNDMAGAIEQSGSAYRYQPEPGGERQRENTIRLWVNIVVYSLTANYKKDLLHTPFISERRKRRPK
jgi:hypothetical protein